MRKPSSTGIILNIRKNLIKSPSHRVLAVLRAEREGFLKVTLMPEEEDAIELIDRYMIRVNGSKAAYHLAIAGKDAYKRLLFPSIENEYINIIREKSETEAIRVFVNNLRQLLLESPLGHKRILALDPGF